MKKVDGLLFQPPKKVNPDDAIEVLLDDPVIRQFVIKHDMKHDAIILGMNDFLTYKDARTMCARCRGLHACLLATSGYTPRLASLGGAVTLEYEKCRYNLTDDSTSRIDAMYVTKKVFEARLDDFDLIGPQRKEIHRYILKFLNEYAPDNYLKGMYLSGLFGAGKTYILAVIANELAKKGCKIIFAYYPDLVRELKSSISTGELESKIEDLKRVEILFLDDLGGETPNEFIRDEVLGPILQHRVLDRKPTFFSSNLKMKVLVEAMQVSQSVLDKSKAIRIYERVHELATEFEISEKPLRNA
ncbi:MAG: primosomal protein DnaI [Candidatus Izemoplasmatales bacterium]|nr:primosomal protein DnaI [Candidatus Izemoplasmatales bacterium]MDD5293727.1 primosomal protein DnaI [Candidatus Izemoplasmatales bacterium]